MTESKSGETYKYILDKHGEPVAEPDLMNWAKWYEENVRTRCRVAREVIGASTVSTVFLGLDHSFGGGPPVLWETLVMGGRLDQKQDRCAGTREQAEAMHARMVEKVKAAG